MKKLKKEYYFGIMRNYIGVVAIDRDHQSNGRGTNSSVIAQNSYSSKQTRIMRMNQAKLKKFIFKYWQSANKELREADPAVLSFMGFNLHQQTPPMAHVVTTLTEIFSNIYEILEFKKTEELWNKLVEEGVGTYQEKSTNWDWWTLRTGSTKEAVRKTTEKLFAKEHIWTKPTLIS